MFQLPQKAKTRKRIGTSPKSPQTSARLRVNFSMRQRGVWNLVSVNPLLKRGKSSPAFCALGPVLLLALRLGLNFGPCILGHEVRFRFLPHAFWLWLCVRSGFEARVRVHPVRPLVLMPSLNFDPPMPSAFGPLRAGNGDYSQAVSRLRAAGMLRLCPNRHLGARWALTLCPKSSPSPFALRLSRLLA